MRVFLVCDDSEFEERLSIFFSQQKNFKVCGKTFPSIAAIQKADKVLPDVAILAVNQLHDFKIADEFQNSMPNLPLFLMTNSPNVDIEKKALSHGVEAVFSVDDELTTLALNAREICT